MNVLVFNVGSTTLKYALIDTRSGDKLTQGLVDRIGQVGGDAVDHLVAANLALAIHGALTFDAIGHRVVQGGTRFTSPTLVTDQSRRELAALDDLAPLHNPPARAVIDRISEQAVRVPQVMVFDTAYFSSLPPKSYRYAVPESIHIDHGVRRYGAHGTSHRFVTDEALHHLAGDRSSRRLISLHLGGGASITASIGGIALETSMGMTPLEGLVMATRCGDIDASVPLHLIRNVGMSAADVDRLLNKQSGLLGMCGEPDMRRVLERRRCGDPSATLAIDVYVHRILKYIGGYMAILGGLDAIVFTAGVGEHSAEIRELVTTPLAHLGIRIDAELNHSADRATVRELSAPGATVRTLVVATNEELAIANQVARLISNHQH